MNEGAEGNEIWKRLDDEKNRQEQIRQKRLLSGSRSPTPPPPLPPTTTTTTTTMNDDDDKDTSIQGTPLKSIMKKQETTTDENINAPPPVSREFKSAELVSQPSSPTRIAARPRRVSITSAYKVTSYNKPRDTNSNNRRRNSTMGYTSPPRYSNNNNNNNVNSDVEGAMQQLQKDEAEGQAQPQQPRPGRTSGGQQQRRPQVKPEYEEPKGWLYMTALFTCLCSTGGLLAIVLFAFGAGQGDIYADTRDLVKYLSPTGTLDLPSSPQRLALEWLVKQDKARIDLVDDQRRREARYSLAVLYYSTEGNTRWEDNLQFLTRNHECSWASGALGVFCDGDGNIVNLSIGGNNLRGELPMELSALSQLTYLDLKDNSLSGTLPFLAFDKIETMYLQENSFLGTIPDSFLSSLVSLRVLDLSSNLLYSTLPQSIGQLSNLERLNLGFNQLTGSMNAINQALPNLRKLNVTHNSFLGTLDFIQYLPLAETLDFTFNSFTGRIPGIIGGLTNLETLSLSENRVFGTIHRSIGSLKKLRYLFVASNELNGEFPWDSFSSSRNENALTEIRISDNSMSGSLPNSIMESFPSLEVVDFSRNLLSGSIPDKIATIQNLKELSLAQNSLTGTLPAVFEYLSLEILDVHSNSLNGTIPETLKSLGSLEMLALHDNRFNGTVPEQLQELDKIERISFHLNQLEGEIDFLCDIEPRPIITADCAGDPPQVQCSCCFLCLE